jgi:hypothetical protein
MAILYFAFLLILSEVLAQELCKPLHSQAPGLNLICCNATGGLSPDCQYKRYCDKKECSCFLIVMADFTCRKPRFDDELVVWENHKPLFNQALPCVGFNFPNVAADYTVTIQKWSQKLVFLFK